MSDRFAAGRLRAGAEPGSPLAGGDRVAAARRLVDVAKSLGALPAFSDAHAREFLERFPMAKVRAAFELLGDDSEGLDAVTLALSKAYSSDYGSRVLPQMSEYLYEALESPLHQVRLLGCLQLGKLVTVSEYTGSEYLGKLVKCLSDPDTSVAQSAKKSLQALAASGPAGVAKLTEGPAAEELKKLLASEVVILRIRALELVADVGGVSEAAAATVIDKGMLDQFLTEVRNTDDLLTCVNVLELAGQLALRVPAAGRMLLHALSGTLCDMADDPVLDANIKLQAMKTLGHMVASTASWVRAPSQENRLMGAFNRIAKSMKVALGGLDTEFKISTLDALAEFGRTRDGASLVCMSPENLVGALADAALNHLAPGPMQLAALHTLAAVAGAERVQGEGHKFCHDVLDPAADHVLRETLYTATAAKEHPATPAEELHVLLERPFADLRVAAYRLISALAARPWAANEICGHGKLFARLVDPLKENERSGCEWRHTCVRVLQSTAELVAAGAADAKADVPPMISSQLKVALPRLKEAAGLGPYGFKKAAAPAGAPEVAVEQRA